MFLKISQISQDKICVGVSFLIQLLTFNFITRDSNNLKFAKLSRTPFTQNNSGGCFWKIYLDRPEKGGDTTGEIYAVI